MTKYVNKSGNRLVLPNNQAVINGGTVDISADMTKNAGVAGWIDSGYLVKASETEAKFKDPAGTEMTAAEKKAQEAAAAAGPGPATDGADANRTAATGATPTAPKPATAPKSGR